jgi:hypothetical protein
LDTQRMLHEVEAEITKLERVADVLRGITSNGNAPQGKRKGMSAAGRKKISLAQKARWAKRGAGSQVVAMKPKRTMSASARRKIAAAQRLRWAKFKASQKKTA